MAWTGEAGAGGDGKVGGGAGVDGGVEVGRGGGAGGEEGATLFLFVTRPSSGHTKAKCLTTVSKEKKDDKKYEKKVKSRRAYNDDSSSKDDEEVNLCLMVNHATHTLFSLKGLPTFQQIHYVKIIADKIEAIAVGIDQFGLFGSPMSDETEHSSQGLLCGQGFSEITHVHIHECDNFSMGVFCLPALKVFPLHDHPGMTVLSKLFHGSAYVKAYCFSSELVSTFYYKYRLFFFNPLFSNFKLIEQHRKKVHKLFCYLKILSRARNAIRTLCGMLIMFPRSGGNIHSFTALTPCVILDVLSPPYSILGRPSTYSCYE
ncbi:plant cysteine oxidase 4-like [Phaseolus vulgaris]|uniref:plant cysteine oxidase 4-like n=1 Tax=Phaseolus vulgaris TaxID=3885 RepID=UPI0035C9A024